MEDERVARFAHAVDSAEPLPEECKLLNGGFAALMQVLLGFIAFSVLIVKRYNEVPQRPLVVWGFDASKQMIGAGFAHVANLLIAILLYQHQLEAQQVLKGIDQCAFYFVNFTMDTTFGVFLNWVFLETFSLLATRCQWTSVMTAGDYGNPIRIRNWLAQLMSWIVIIFVTKVVIAIFIVALEKPLGELAMWVFAPLRPYPHVELALVMIACPCLMNAVQFWIQDSFLKKDIRDDCVLVATSTSKASANSVGSITRMTEKSALTDASSSTSSLPSSSPLAAIFTVDDEDDDDTVSANDHNMTATTTTAVTTAAVVSSSSDRDVVSV